MMGTKRIGKITISPDIFASDFGVSTYDVLRAVQDGCAVSRCEYLFHLDAFEMIAEHPEFANVPKGQSAPDYHVVLGRDEDGQLRRLKFVSRDDEKHS